MWITRSLGNPKKKVWCSKAAVSLDYKTKVIEPVGLGEGLARCQWCRLRQLTWTCWYVSNVSIIFEWSMLILWCCHMFLLSYHIIFMHFFGLTYWQDAQCQFPVFTVFVFQKFTSENILGIGRKFTGIILCQDEVGVRRAASEATHRAQAASCRGLGGTCPWATSSAPSDAYKIRNNLKTLGQPLFSTEDNPTRLHLKP